MRNTSRFLNGTAPFDPTFGELIARREERQNLGVSQLPTDLHRAVSPNCADLKHPLRLIDSDVNDILLQGPNPRLGLTTTSLNS